MNRRPLALLLALAALGATAPAAAADRADKLLLEACRTGTVTGRYSQRDYERALDRLPADSDQYTDCRDVLRRAKLRAVGGSPSGDESGAGGAAGGGGGGGGIDPATGRRLDPLASATPQERREIEAAGKAGAAPIALAGERIVPGGPGTLTGSAMPPVLIVLVALLTLLALGGGGRAAATRVRARRPAT